MADTTFIRTDMPPSLGGLFPPFILRDVPFSWAPSIINLAAPVTLTISGPALPSGLSFNAATGTISGTPVVVGTANGITITATDFYGRTANIIFNIFVSADVPAPGPGEQIINGILVRADVPAVPALPGSYANTIYVDFDAATDGPGTSASPRNKWIASASDPAIAAGTRLLCKGTLTAQKVYGSGSWDSLGGNTEFLARFGRGGTEAAPVYVVGNDPDWGTATFDGAYDISTSAAANQADAMGSSHWANLVVGTLTRHTGHNTEYTMGCFFGPDRLAGRMSCYPSYDDENWLDYRNFLPMGGYEDIFWYPGINPASIDFLEAATLARPRLNIGTSSHLPPADSAALRAACDAEQTPILQMRASPNTWLTMPCTRCDADGTPDASGDYLIANEAGHMSQQVKSSGTPWYPAAYYLVGVMNLAAHVDRKGRFAMRLDGEATSKVVAWPRDDGGSPLGLARASGFGGLGLTAGADDSWIYGFRFKGFLPRYPASKVYGVAISATTTMTRVRIDSNHIGSHIGIGIRSTPQMYMIYMRNDCIVRRNFLDENCMSRSMEFGSNTRLLVEQNHCFKAAGDGIAFFGGGHAVQTTIRNNLVVGRADIHGNAISFYMRGYGARITGNVTRGSDRAFTTQGSDHDEATYGTAYVFLENNSFMLSPDSVAPQHAFWANGDNVRNILLRNNFCGANLNYDNNAVMVKTGSISETQMYVYGNTFVGPLTEAIAARPGNTKIARGTPEAAAAITAHLTDTPSVPVGPA